MGIIGETCDCAHVYLQTSSDFHAFTQEQSQHYLGSRKALRQVLNLNGEPIEERKNESGNTAEEEWSPLYTYESKAEDAQGIRIITAVNEKEYTSVPQRASAPIQNEMIEAWVNHEVERIRPEFESFINSPSQENHEDIRKKYLEQFSSWRNLVDQESGCAEILKKMIEKCISSKSFSASEARELANQTGGLVHTGGLNNRTGMMRNNLGALFGSTHMGYNNQPLDVIDRNLNFCEIKNSVISIDAGVINRPPILGNVQFIRQSIPLEIKVNSGINPVGDLLRLALVSAKAKESLGTSYQSVIDNRITNGSQSILVEQLLEPPKQQNTCRHHALLTAILLGQYEDFESVNVFRGTAYNLSGHSWVMCKKGDKRYLVDSHLDQVFEMSSPEQRNQAILFYQRKGLDGVLANLFEHGRKLWGWDMGEHPPIRQLTFEAIYAPINRASGYRDDKYNNAPLIHEMAPNRYRCLLTGTMMLCPVIVFDQDSDVPYTFDYNNLLLWIQSKAMEGRYATNPITGKPLDVQRMFLDLNLLREMWDFVQNCAAPKEEAGESKLSKPEEIELLSLTDRYKNEMIQKASENNRRINISPAYKLPKDCFTQKKNVNDLHFETMVDIPLNEDKQIAQALPSLTIEASSPYHVPASFIRFQKFFKQTKEKLTPFNKYKTSDLFSEFTDQLTALRGDKTIPKEIPDQIERLLLNIVELQREEDFLEYKTKRCGDLKKDLKETITNIKLFSEDPGKNGQKLEDSLIKLNTTAQQLTERNEKTSAFQRFKLT